MTYTVIRSAVYLWRDGLKPFFMDVEEVYKRLWQAPNGHTYFGWFSDNYHDHLFDVSKMITLLYDTTTTEALAGDIDKLVIEYFLEATKNDEAWVTEPKNASSG